MTTATPATGTTATSAAGAETAVQPTRTRAGLKRIRFNPPVPAYPVRGLWNSATEGERQTAHRTCVVILEMWLGKVGRPEAARRLGMTHLRLTQLSQQAVSGMMAGLLRQPRCRVPKGVLERRPAPENDPTVLKRRVAKLIEDLQRTENLVRVLQELPMQRGSEAPDRKERKRGAKTQRPKSAAGTAGGSTARGSDPAAEAKGS